MFLSQFLGKARIQARQHVRHDGGLLVAAEQAQVGESDMKFLKS